VQRSMCNVYSMANPTTAPLIPNPQSLFCWLLFPALLVGLCGCGNTATVTGTVSYQGRPVTHGSVMFLSADKTARSGVIEPDGSYTVEGVPRGTVQIAVISHNPSKGRSVLRDQKPVHPGKKEAAWQEAAIKRWFPLPAKFEAPATSDLGCTIDSGRVSHDIDLK
jgi:hypothetical protein